MVDIEAEAAHVETQNPGAARQGRCFASLPRLAALGALSIIPYAYALQLQDLRAHTVEFEIAFFIAFALYALAVVLVLRADLAACRLSLAILFSFALLFRALLVFTPPTLSDDMYRYVWDGRVQAQGLSPYAYPPDASRLAYLRDDVVWTHINRKEVVTVYPAGAELAFAALWRLAPDSVRWFQIASAAGDLAAGGLLLLLLRALKLPAGRVLIYLWNPLVIFETAHAAHVDGLVLPFLVAALLARAKNRDALTGAMLGIAAALKLYPVLLLPTLWRMRADTGAAENEHDSEGKARRITVAWRMPAAFVAVFGLTYVPYLGQGASVLGFLPNYFNERFNMGLSGLVTDWIESPPAPLFAALSQAVDGSAPRVVNAILAAALVIVSLALVLRPARDARQALGRCIYPIGAFTLLTQNLFPWYLLWVVPLVAVFVQPGRLGLRFDAWTGWFLFTGLVALAYTFFIAWTPVPWALGLQFIPLYALLILSAAWQRLRPSTPRPLGLAQDSR